MSDLPATSETPTDPVSRLADSAFELLMNATDAEFTTLADTVQRCREEAKMLSFSSRRANARFYGSACAFVGLIQYERKTPDGRAIRARYAKAREIIRDHDTTHEMVLCDIIQVMESDEDLTDDDSVA